VQNTGTIRAYNTLHPKWNLFLDSVRADSKHS